MGNGIRVGTASYTPTDRESAETYLDDSTETLGHFPLKIYNHRQTYTGVFDPKFGTLCVDQKPSS